MKPTKKPKLVLSRETVRALSQDDLRQARGAYVNKTYTCPTYKTSCFQTCASCQSVCTSCFDTDCCLIVP
jgi:hypothetical protein